MNQLFCALITGFFCLPVASVLGKGDVGEDIKTGDLWLQSLTDSKLGQNEYGSWVAKDTTLRIPQPKFSLGKLKVGETLIQLKDKKVQEVTFSVYNRGDDGNLDRDKFRAKLDEAKAAIDEILGVEAKVYKPSRANTAVKIEGFTWKWDGGNMLLEYSISNPSVKNFTGEFIRITAVPKGASVSSSSEKKGASGKKITKEALKERVTTNEDGAVYIKDVPMVDQGSKGYCAAAATARVLGYYGIDIDQHEVAQLGKSDADKGTDPNVMLKEISKVISGRFGLGVKTLESIDSVRDALTLIRIYNREAKKMDKVQISTEGHIIDLPTIWATFDSEALLQARASNKSRVDKWQKTIKGYIDLGIPVLWGVQLGLYPENKKISQTKGGHLRLIIGYNEKDKTLVFSDSWGSGHEFKTIGIPEAMSMTTHLDVIFPRQ